MATVTVGCKLPHGIILELDEKKATIAGSNSSSIIGGHGLTEDVDKEFFDAWMLKNKELSFVKAGHLFAHEKANNTAAQAKERAGEVTGFEGINPDKKPDGLTEVE